MNLKDALLKDKNKAFSFDAINYSQEIALNSIAQKLDCGAKIIQFYFKNASDSQNVEIGHKLRQLCSIYNALLVVNSRADIAQIIQADGLCLFKGDITPIQAKKIFHNDIILAMHIRNDQDAILAYENQIDYICADEDNKPLLNGKIKALNKIKIIELDRQIL